MAVIRTEDAEALAGRHQVRRRDIDVAEAGCRSEDDDRLAHSRLTISNARCIGRPDDQIVETIAVDVACRGDGPARPVAQIRTEDAKARAGGHEIRRRHIDVAEARSLAEDHDRFAGIDLSIGAAVAGSCPDDQVVKAIAVDVARRGDGEARIVICIRPKMRKPCEAVMVPASMAPVETLTSLSTRSLAGPLV